MGLSNFSLILTGQEKFWPLLTKFQKFWPSLTGHQIDCQLQGLQAQLSILRIDRFMVNLGWNREKCFISFTGLSLFWNCHSDKKISLKIWPDQWNYAKLVNRLVTGQGLIRPLRQGCINTADIINFERRYLICKFIM